MVKELELFECHSGCGLNAGPKENIPTGRYTTLLGPEPSPNVFPMPFGVGRAITRSFSTFQYFYLTG